MHVGAPAVSGIATSATNRRCWDTNAGVKHHLIDPATGEPIASGITSVTAFAPTVTQAEIATKAIMVAAGRGLPLDTAGSTFAACVGQDAPIRFIEQGAIA